MAQKNLGRIKIQLRGGVASVQIQGRSPRGNHFTRLKVVGEKGQLPGDVVLMALEQYENLDVGRS